MSDREELVRFGVSFPAQLIGQFDSFIEQMLLEPKFGTQRVDHTDEAEDEKLVEAERKLQVVLKQKA